MNSSLPAGGYAQAFEVQGAGNGACGAFNGVNFMRLSNGEGHMLARQPQPIDASWRGH